MSIATSVEPWLDDNESKYREFRGLQDDLIADDAKSDLEQVFGE